MVGQCGLGHPGTFNQFAGALFTLLKQFQDSLPPLIAEGFENFGSLFVDSFHCITSNRIFLI
jgi:hypothetical protein